VDACKFPEIFCKVSFMWSEHTNDNKPYCVHTTFDPDVVEESNPKPMISPNLALQTKTYYSHPK